MWARREADCPSYPQAAQAQRRVGAHHHRPPFRPAHRPDPRDKKSHSTMSSPILAWRSRTSLSWSRTRRSAPFENTSTRRKRVQQVVSSAQTETGTMTPARCGRADCRRRSPCGRCATGRDTSGTEVPAAGSSESNPSSILPDRQRHRPDKTRFFQLRFLSASSRWTASERYIRAERASFRICRPFDSSMSLPVRRAGRVPGWLAV